MNKLLFLCLLFMPYRVKAQQTTPWSQKMTATIMATYPDSAVARGGRMAHWDYEMGLMMHAVEQVWHRTGDAHYVNYMLKSMDQMVNDDGSIKNYQPDKFNIDFIAPGRSLLLLSQLSVPKRDKYRKAADLIRKQLAEQPRTNEGGFWHKKVYPNQMWLDGLYMAEPFYAEYTSLFDQDGKAFDDIINQFVWMEQHARDEKTGLLYHAWDESREQKWADPKTGKSPNFWSRSLGWYGMALVDVLDYIPVSHPRRTELVTILQRFMPAVLKYQDPASGCWYQITDRISDAGEGKAGNYLEASGTAMFVYTLAKGVRLGYLPAIMLSSARKGYQGMLQHFISTDAKGLVHLEKTVAVGGLGGNPYRDGSYKYYLSEPLRQDDLKGVGPFVLASLELEAASERGTGKALTIGLDTHFNQEFRKVAGKDGAARQEPYHYTWEDRQHSGFWLWGNTFRDMGAKTVSVSAAPTAAALKSVDVYIIVDPDTPKETATPNYINPVNSKAISDWVKAGGVLVLMANDTANCEHLHLNQLAAQFGMQFLPKNINMVKSDQFDQGRVDIPTNNAIFPTTKSVYIKELAPIAVTAPAKAIISKGDDVIMSVAKWGKGTVFAVGDPWLYNEYTDGRKIPATFDNFSACKDLATWLLKQVP